MITVTAVLVCHAPIHVLATPCIQLSDPTLVGTSHPRDGDAVVVRIGPFANREVEARGLHVRKPAVDSGIGSMVSVDAHQSSGQGGWGGEGRGEGHVSGLNSFRSSVWMNNVVLFMRVKRGYSGFTWKESGMKEDGGKNMAERLIHSLSFGRRTMQNIFYVSCRTSLTSFLTVRFVMHSHILLSLEGNCTRSINSFTGKELRQ